MRGLACCVVLNKLDFSLERGVVFACEILRLLCILPLDETFLLWTWGAIGLFTLSLSFHSAVHYSPLITTIQLLHLYNYYLLWTSEIPELLHLPVIFRPLVSCLSIPLMKVLTVSPLSHHSGYKYSLSTSESVLISNQLEPSRTLKIPFHNPFIEPLLARNIIF